MRQPVRLSRLSWQVVQPSEGPEVIGTPRTGSFGQTHTPVFTLQKASKAHSGSRHSAHKRKRTDQHQLILLPPNSELHLTNTCMVTEMEQSAAQHMKETQRRGVNKHQLLLCALKAPQICLQHRQRPFFKQHPPSGQGRHCNVPLP